MHTQVHKYTSAHSSTQLHKYTGTPQSHFLAKPIPCAPDIDVHQLSQKMMQLQHVLSQLCCSYAHFVFENTFCPEDISTKQDTYAMLQNGYKPPITTPIYEAFANAPSVEPRQAKIAPEQKKLPGNFLISHLPAIVAAFVEHNFLLHLRSIVAPFALGLSLRESHPVQEFLFGCTFREASRGVIIICTLARFPVGQLFASAPESLVIPHLFMS